MLYATCRFSAQLCIQYSCACSRNRCLPPTRDFSIPFHGSTSSLIGRQWKTQQEPFFADGRAFKCSVLTKRVVKSACLRLVFAGTNECRDKIHHPASDCLLACEDHQGTTSFSALFPKILMPSGSPSRGNVANKTLGEGIGYALPQFILGALKNCHLVRPKKGWSTVWTEIRRWTDGPTASFTRSLGHHRSLPSSHQRVCRKKGPYCLDDQAIARLI